MPDFLIYEQSGPIVTLTMNEPDKRNPLSGNTSCSELVAAAERIHGDPGVRCVILTGKGEAFSSGGNIKAMRNGEGMFGGAPVDMRRGYQTTIHGIPRSIYALEVPTICAVNGPAIGAGCDLTLMCDIRIAGRKAVFAESFLRVGLVSGDLCGTSFPNNMGGYSRRRRRNWAYLEVPAGGNGGHVCQTIG